MTEYIELISPLCLHFLDNFYRCKNFIKYDIALRKKKVVTEGMRCPRWWKCLPPTLFTWVWVLEPTGWKESCKLFSDLCIHTVTYASLNISINNCLFKIHNGYTLVKLHFITFKAVVIKWPRVRLMLIANFVGIVGVILFGVRGFATYTGKV